jgi:hypothetical protein
MNQVVSLSEISNIITENLYKKILTHIMIY